MTGDELEHALTDWSLYLTDQNGDLEPAQWATVDRLLDELGRRLGLASRPCWHCGDDAGVACCEFGRNASNG